ncbi:hypothetical protein KSC_086760 [Ktedonobacter sp. SOSP1-52]|uniref:hypothetical protein n=1 Tax=Ktedonobacter sp. SOSP1-52 TaxID=2778366 RepID=UPI0019160F7F|nr:hypothetical protein [Ktedonobacter sp. SOSP1-52]GHO69784.1 hypothetical protein KSC_086760 [Ktedonobacter sp. SOSP1-52]
MLEVCTHNTCIGCGGCHEPDCLVSQPYCLPKRWNVALRCAEIAGFTVGFCDGLVVISQGDQQTWYPLTEDGLHLVEAWLFVFQDQRLLAKYA